MAAGDSKVSIANIGLSALGEDPIADINQGQKRAICMKGAFDRVLRALLEKHPWRFAKKLAQLAANPVAPAFGYGNAFDLPDDFVRMYDEIDDGEDWEIVGGQLMTDGGGPLNIVYIAFIQDPTKFPPLFCMMLGLELASDQCEAITQSDAKQAKVDKRLSDVRAEAFTSSAQQANPREWDDDILLRSRH